MSSDDLAIRADRLSKRYHLGERQRYRTLREALVEAARAPFRARRAEPRETIWALRDVSFEIRHGEVVGVIGPNGAGKSTLLKILSRITEPTSGRAELHGRVGSLLEVGTGFHSELTGRENIFLSGAVLGMRRAEIARKFDEIVGFAEVERFIDTPVKHYSSGMYLRLAFAVAAHLEPEILLVDEVLAVGDAQFQRRCLGKMSEVAGAGRTVIFVSHQMPAVQTMCSRAFLLRSGSLAESGPATAVVARYLAEAGGRTAATQELGEHPGRSHSRERALRRVWIEDGEGRRCSSVPMGAVLRVGFEFQAARPIRNPGFGFGIEDSTGRRVFSLNNYMVPSADNTFFSLAAGQAFLHLPMLPLLPDVYSVSVSLVEDQHEWVDYVERAITFEVAASDFYGSGKIPERSQGVVVVPGSVAVDAEARPPDAAGQGDDRV